jgi:hypothetical protein
VEHLTSGREGRIARQRGGVEGQEQVAVGHVRVRRPAVGGGQEVLDPVTDRSVHHPETAVHRQQLAQGVVPGRGGGGRDQRQRGAGVVQFRDGLFAPGMAQMHPSQIDEQLPRPLGGDGGAQPIERGGPHAAVAEPELGIVERAEQLDARRHVAVVFGPRPRRAQVDQGPSHLQLTEAGDAEVAFDRMASGGVVVVTQQ